MRTKPWIADQTDPNEDAAEFAAIAKQRATAVTDSLFRSGERGAWLAEYYADLVDAYVKHLTSGAPLPMWCPKLAA